MSARARTHFAAARDAAGAIRWLASLARYRAELLAVSTENLALQGQIERLEATLLKLGTKHEARFAQKEKAILDGLNSADTTQFETAHKDLGEMLGFDAGRHESDASPDPWWTSGKYCLVFEDHSGADPKSSLGADKARQANGHPKWMKANTAITHVTEDTEILSVLVTPVKRAEAGAFPHLTDVALWPLANFRAWAREALNVVRQLRRTMGDECDLAWRAEAQAAFEAKGYDAAGLMRSLAASNAAQALKK